jgi:hypothetical protein
MSLFKQRIEAHNKHDSIEDEHLYANFYLGFRKEKLVNGRMSLKERLREDVQAKSQKQDLIGKDGKRSSIKKVDTKE